MITRDMSCINGKAGYISEAKSQPDKVRLSAFYGRQIFLQGICND